jgi:hypothetical protein
MSAPKKNGAWLEIFERPDLFLWGIQGPKGLARLFPRLVEPLAKAACLLRFWIDLLFAVGFAGRAGRPVA